MTILQIRFHPKKGSFNRPFAQRIRFIKKQARVIARREGGYVWRVRIQSVKESVVSVRAISRSNRGSIDRTPRYIPLALSVLTNGSPNKFL